MANTPKQVYLGEPTIFSNIVLKDGKYVPTGIDPFFDMDMQKRLDWMTATNGGKNVQPGDTSMFAFAAQQRGLPPEEQVTVTSTSSVSAQSETDASSRSDSSRFAWLGDQSNMEYIGKGDAHRCFICKVGVENFVSGDTFLNQHAYYSGGECQYLQANYTAERLKMEIGKERFRRGFVAHPEVIKPLDPWKDSEVEVTNLIYVTLATHQCCYMCGHLAGQHGPHCYQKMQELTRWLEDSLRDLKL